MQSYGDERIQTTVSTTAPTSSAGKVMLAHSHFLLTGNIILLSEQKVEQGDAESVSEETKSLFPRTD